MSTSIPNERVLRQITIAMLLPSFPIIVAAGIMSDQRTHSRYYYHSGPIIILFGLIPIFISALTSIMHLQSTHDPLHKRPLLHSSVWFIIDALLVAANFAVLVPVWAFEPAALGWASDIMMLETYATVFLMISAGIHGYLALYVPIKKLTSRANFRIFYADCPHCHKHLKAVEIVGSKKNEGLSLLRAEQYLDEEPEAQASTGIIRGSDSSAVASASLVAASPV